MAYRVRIYPSYGGYGGMGAYGGAYSPYATQARVSQVKLQNERTTGNLRLQYERALWAEKIRSTQLQTAMQYANLGTASPYSYGYGGFGSPLMGAGLLGGVGGLGGLGTLGLAGGQVNVTNQMGGGTQTVSNANTHHSRTVIHPGMQASPYGFGSPWAGGYGGYPQSGGLLSGLLGWLV
jgi:hypothetical protein